METDKSLLLLFLPALMTGVQVEVGYQGYSACHETSDQLSFSRDLNADEDYAREGKFLIITCCANRFDGEIEWYHMNNGTKSVFAPRSSNYKFDNRGQVLNIRKVSMNDNGTFICKARNTSDSVEMNITLFVNDCNRVVGRVVPMRTPPKVKYAALGETFSLDCQGYYGCGMRIFKDVYWFQGENIIDENYTMYHLESLNRENDTILGKRLIFKEVTEATFTYNYTCVLAVPQPYGKTFPSKILPKPTETILPMWAIILIIVSVVLGVLVIVALPVGLYGPQIRFFVKAKTGWGYSARQDGVTYDAFLLSSHESQEYVSQHIYSILTEEFEYEVYFHYEDNHCGGTDCMKQMEGVQKSASTIIFLRSDEEIENNTRFNVKNALHIHSGSKVLIVHQGELKKCLQHFTPEDRMYLRACRTLKWPSSMDRKSRECKNFWSTVQRYLPRPTTTGNQIPNGCPTEHTELDVESNRHGSSSEHPLLTDNRE